MRPSSWNVEDGVVIVDLVNSSTGARVISAFEVGNTGFVSLKQIGPDATELKIYLKGDSHPFEMTNDHFTSEAMFRFHKALVGAMKGAA